MKGKKYICSFADKRLNLTLKRFGEQAKQMNVYDGIFYTRKMIWKMIFTDTLRISLT
jgi:hypothetical protein